MVARFHYDDSIYQQFLADEQTPRDQSDVTAHIEGCTDCQSRLEAINGVERVVITDFGLARDG